MLDKVLSYFPALPTSYKAAQILLKILEYLIKNYLNSGNFQDSAIDAVIEYLESCKSKK